MWKKYHACISCGMMDWEYDYCSEQCYSKGPDYHNITTLLDEVICKMGIEFAEELVKAFYDGYDRYKWELPEYIEDAKKVFS